MKKFNIIYGILFLIVSVPFIGFYYMVFIQGSSVGDAIYYWGACKFIFSIFIFILACFCVYLFRLVKYEREKNVFFERITCNKLVEFGFCAVHDDDFPYAFEFEKIKVMQFNNDFWIVDMLDQQCINIEFRTMSQLNEFFKILNRPFM